MASSEKTLEALKAAAADERGEYLHFMRLWDIYSPLLTPHQREITDLYFNCDLSLAEIAEERGVSRQSVSDCLNKTRRQMEEYENKLHFLRTAAEMSLHLSFLQTDIARWAEGAQLTPAQRGGIEALLAKDYAQEVAAALKEHADILL